MREPSVPPAPWLNVGPTDPTANKLLTELRAAVQRILGTRIGGVWLSQSGNQTVANVAASPLFPSDHAQVQAAAAALSRFPYPLTVISVPYPKATLDTHFQTLNSGLPGPGIGLEIRPDLGKVVVTVSQDAMPQVQSVATSLVPYEALAFQEGTSTGEVLYSPQ